MNRKRKSLEKKSLLRYFSYIDLSHQGADIFKGREMYIITFTSGITRKDIIEKIREMDLRFVYIKHVLESFISEKDGRAVFMLIIESRKHEDLAEIFNAEFAPEIMKMMGDDCIHAIETYRLTHQVNALHNYMVDEELKKKMEPPDIRERFIFVDD